MNIKKHIQSAVDINPGEGKLVGLMFLYNFVLLVTLYLLKPVRDSLFLVELGPQQLPIVFIFTAIAAIPISVGYSRLSNRSTLGWVINGVTVFLAATLVLIWWLLRVESPVLYYILYIWVSIYSILVTSQFWLLANALFTSIQAKRIFSVLSLAAIAGAIAGGEITGLLVNGFRITPQTLLLIGAGLLLSTVFLVQVIRRHANRLSAEVEFRPHQQEQESTSNSKILIKDIIKSRHLLLIIGIIALSVITTTIIDYQFKTVASRFYVTDNALTTFMGHFYGRVSIIAFLLQLFLSSKFLERRGVGGAVAILPSILLLGTVGLFIWPGLIAATMLRGADQSLKHSLDRTGRELLFIPVEIDVKKRTKVFIDLFVDNGAQGLAGILLLLLTFVLTLTVQQLSIVVAGLLVCWMTLAVWVRNSYIDEFRGSIQEQVSVSESKRVKESELSLDELTNNLQNSDAQKVEASLKELELNYSKEDLPVEVLESLLDHEIASVRKQSLHLFHKLDIEGYMEPIAVLLEDSSPEVRLEAARYIYHFYDPQKYDEGSRLDILREGLNHEDVKIRAAAFGLIVKDGGEQEKALLSTELLEKTLHYKGDNEEELKIETARVLGVAYDSSRIHILRALLRDKSIEVVKEAILSAGKSGERKFIHILLEYLDSEAHKKAAQQGLAIYGERIFGTLFDYLTDDQVKLSKRLSIPSVLYFNAGQVALDVLQLALDSSNMPVRHEIIKALNKVKQKMDHPVFNEDKLKSAVYEEARRYAFLQQSHHIFKEGKGHQQMCELLTREAALGFENIFRLLGLIYNSEDVYNAYKGIKSGKKTLVSDGIEFLENLIEWEVKKPLIPILESVISGEKDYGNFTGSVATINDAIEFLLGLKHPHLQNLALEIKNTN